MSKKTEHGVFGEFLAIVKDSKELVFWRVKRLLSVLNVLVRDSAKNGFSIDDISQAEMG